MPFSNTAVIIVLLSFFMISENQHFASEKDEYTIKQLKVKDGLSQSSILAILQDKKGFMWFATGRGLNKYDGYNFSVYLNNTQDSTSISDNGISALFEDKDGYIWVGTTGGFVNRFDRRTEVFKKYNLNLFISSAKLINDDYYEFPLLFSRSSDNSITSITEDKLGRIWIGTWGKGVFVLDKANDSMTNLTHDPNDSRSLSFDRVTKILPDKDSHIWIATFGGGLNKVLINVDQRKIIGKLPFQHFKCVRSNKKSLSDDKVITLFEDKNGSLWIGTYYGGLNKLNFINKNLNPELAEFVHFNFPAKSLGDNSIMAITEDNSGYLWIGTFGGGLNRLDPKNSTNIKFVHNNFNENSIADNDIISLYKDDAGIIWVGTHLGEGISRIEKRIIKFDLLKSVPSSSASLNDDVIWSIFKDKDKILWIGTYRGGLNRYDESKKRFDYYKHDPFNPKSLSNNHVRSIAEDKFGNLWVGTYAGGLNRFDIRKETFSRYFHNSSDPISIGSNQIQQLYIDSNAVMWIASFGGGLNALDLNSLSSEKPNFIKYRNDPSDPTSLSDNRVYTIYEDRNHSLWVGTFGGGLNKFDRKNKKFKRFQNDPQNSFSLQTDKVLCLYEDLSHNFWIGTYGNGLIKFDRKRNSFISYGADKNLDADVIYGILEDDKKNLWLSSSNGIYKFSYVNETATHYDMQDGVQSLEFNGGAYFKASDGEMFFGGINGMNRFDPEQIEDYKYIPSVVITSIRISNNIIKGEKDILDLSYRENFISFEFAALAYSDPADNYYSYMLEGFDDDWKSTDSKYRIANYTNLSPGEYIFKVRGSNQDKIWNLNETKIHVLIHPPFWQRWWFTLLTILIISGGIFYLGSMRTRNELAIEKLKTKLAADLHDNIGSGLTEISILSELAKKDIEITSNPVISGRLKNISEVSRQLVDNMSDIVWVVNPKRDSLHDLLVRLKDSYSDILSSYGISFKISNLDKLDNLTLPMDYRQNLYLIFKEGINNAIKHSKCKKMILEANVNDNILELTLTDDGVGFDPQNLDFGNGIKNIEARSKHMEGKLKWESSSQKGTTIRFVGEIKKNRGLSKILNQKIIKKV
jgi:ligand-binding sensor domain-containing protein/two-component sensor histidine kinase